MIILSLLKENSNKIQRMDKTCYLNLLSLSCLILVEVFLNYLIRRNKKKQNKKKTVHGIKVREICTYVWAC